MNQEPPLQKTELEKEYYNFLLLSIYFYLKHNNYNISADFLFNEANLNNLFFFPQDISDSSTEEEKLKKSFINYFYANSFFHINRDKFDIIAEFWGQFWDVFAEKIKHSNTAISPMQEYLSFEGDKMKIVCIILTLDNEETYHKKEKEEDEKSNQE